MSNLFKKFYLPTIISLSLISSLAMGMNSNEIPNIKILTLNVWFDSFQADFRYKAILNIIKEEDPDIICLQEVTNKFLSLAQKDKNFTRNYRSAFDLDSSLPKDAYTVMILAKKTLHPQFGYEYFSETNMDRGFSWANLEIGDKTLFLITSHLESLDPNSVTRAWQLKQINEMTTLVPDVIFAGDFNLSDHDNNSNLVGKYLPEYQDWWTLLHPGESGNTFNPQINPMAYGSKSRFDRIVFKSKLITAKSIKIIGNQELDMRNGQPIYPSDHFGLVAEFTLGDSRNENANSWWIWSILSWLKKQIW